MTRGSERYFGLKHTSIPVAIIRHEMKSEELWVVHLKIQINDNELKQLVKYVIKLIKAYKKVLTYIFQYDRQRQSRLKQKKLI